jgi:hypothetical protein
VILEDDEPDTPNLEAAVVSDSVDTGTDFAFELSKPIDPPDHEAWCDVGTGYYVNKELLPGLEPEQEGLAASAPVPDHSYSHYHSPGPSSHDRIGQYNDDGNTQRTSDEPRPYTPPKSLEEDSGGESGENVSELEIDMLLAFEEQEKSSSATAPTPRPHHHSTRQSHSRIDQEDDQDETDYERLEEPRHNPPLRSQDQEEEPQEQQRLEVVVDAMREGEVEDDGCDSEQQGKWREKLRRQDGTEEVSSNSNNSEGPIPIKRRRPSPSSSHPTPKSGRTQRLQQPDTRSLISQSSPVKAGLVLAEKELQRPSLLLYDSSDDSEAPRPAKRRRPSSSKSDPSCRAKRQYQRPSRNPSRQGRSHTVPPQTQLHKPWPIRSDGCAQAQHNSTHSKDGEPVPTTAEYQEWPIHGFLKRTTIGNEIRYSMDFSLEQLQGLCAGASHLHSISPSSGRDFTERMNLPKVSTLVKKAQLAPLSQSKRTPFTSKENAMLVDLKENKKWSWKQIDEKFPRRTLNSLQVHYCTKLKGKLLTEEDGGE